MKLSDSAIKNAKSLPDKAYKMPDGKGLYVFIHTNGSKYFRLDYRFEGKRYTLALGVYPGTSLKQARDKAALAKQQIADGINPTVQKKAIKHSKAESAANSFEIIAREWGQKNVNGWNDKYNRSKRMLEKNIFQWLGGKPIKEILPIDILNCLRRIEAKGTIETAHRTLQVCGQVFRYAVATARADRDITADLKGALPPAKGTHFAAITEPKEVAGLLRAIDGYSGSFSVLCALKIAPLVFQRPGELRAAQWQHINLETQEWRYFVSKTEVQHIVPLSRQVAEILKELQQLTGHGVWLFPSERNPRNTFEGRCMSENTLNGALKRLGYGKEVMTTHGFRAMARTILDEVLGFRVEYIEHQLAHAVKDPNGRAYNRTAHLAERHKMMQAWADYLDQLKTGGNVIPINSKKAG